MNDAKRSLYFTPEHLAVMRSSRHPVMQELWAGTKEQWLTQPPAFKEFQPAEVKLEGWKPHCLVMEYESLLYGLTNDVEHADRATRVVRRVLDHFAMHLEKDRSVLREGLALWRISTAVHYCRDVWAANGNGDLLQECMSLLENNIEVVFEFHDSYQRPTINNHFTRTLLCMTLVGLALAETAPGVAQECLQRVDEDLPHVLRGFSPDGSYDNAGMQMALRPNLMLLIMWILKNNGRDYFPQWEHGRNYARFREYVTVGGGRKVLHIIGHQDLLPLEPWIPFMFARAYKDAHAQDLGLRVWHWNKHPAFARQSYYESPLFRRIMALIAFDPELEPRFPQLPKGRLFEDTDLVAMRTGFEADSYVSLLKCGPLGGSYVYECCLGDLGHSLPGAGHINYVMGDQVMLEGAGMGLSTSTRLFNTMTVGYLGQYKSPPDGELGVSWRMENPEGVGGEIAAFLSSGESHYCRADLTGSYPPERGVKNMARHAFFFGNGQVWLFDDVELESPDTLQWRMYSRALVTCLTTEDAEQYAFCLFRENKLLQMDVFSSGNCEVVAPTDYSNYPGTMEHYQCVEVDREEATQHVIHALMTPLSSETRGPTAVVRKTVDGEIVYLRGSGLLLVPSGTYSGEWLGNHVEVASACFAMRTSSTGRLLTLIALNPGKLVYQDLHIELEPGGSCEIVLDAKDACKTVVAVRAAEELKFTVTCPWLKGVSVKDDTLEAQDCGVSVGLHAGTHELVLEFSLERKEFTFVPLTSDLALDHVPGLLSLAENIPAEGELWLLSTAEGYDESRAEYVGAVAAVAQVGEGCNAFEAVCVGRHREDGLVQCSSSIHLLPAYTVAKGTYLSRNLIGDGDMRLANTRSYWALDATLEKVPSAHFPGFSSLLIKTGDVGGRISQQTPGLLCGEEYRLSLVCEVRRGEFWVGIHDVFDPIAEVLTAQDGLQVLERQFKFLVPKRNGQWQNEFLGTFKGRKSVFFGMKLSPDAEVLVEQVVLECV